MVALDIGPLGELLAPAGSLGFEEAVARFASVVRAGTAAGADLIVIETMTDLYELKAALLRRQGKQRSAGARLDEF